jgi:hypothetical protein
MKTTFIARLATAAKPGQGKNPLDWTLGLAGRMPALAVPGGRVRIPCIPCCK